MITAVTTSAQKAAFAAAAAGKPHFGAVLGTDLALWADNPGAPIKLYTANGAALSISGHRALLCGTTPGFDWEELQSFLQFCGVEKLLCAEACPAPAAYGWWCDKDYSVFVLPKGGRLPLPPTPPLVAQGALALAAQPPMLGVAKLLFPQDDAQQEYFYTVACTAINHGYGAALALLQNGQVVTTVGCYERAGGEAYMAAGETVPELRGQGLGGWLIVTLANRLAAQGYMVTLLCEEKLNHFYARLGFVQNGIYRQYNTMA